MTNKFSEIRKREHAQCGQELMLVCDPDKFAGELCDEEGFFTMYCVKEDGHGGYHETSTIRWFPSK